MKHEPVLEEFSRAVLGHGARTKRLEIIARGLLENPSASFPNAAANASALEGTYRFLNNASVKWTDVIAPHFAGTAVRIESTSDPIVVVHDTTEAEFSGEERDVGRLRSTQSSGFFVHAALAVTGRVPHGLLGAQVIARDTAPRARRSGAKSFVDPNKESTRWWTLVEEVRAQIGAHDVVHVMDRQADSFELFSKLVDMGETFVIRSAHDRCLAGGDRLHGKVRSAPIAIKREVALSRRARSPAPTARRINPPRAERIASMELHATAVELRRPQQLPKKGWPETVALNAVVVEEIDAPDDAEAVQWFLLTNLPTSTASEIEAVVDAYRQRWMIEEYFKALKSGCAYESRQLESRDALVRALAILAPLAWRLFHLRALAELHPDADAEILMTPTELRVLRHLHKPKLALTLTANEALLAIAAIGGHLKRNGSPGWLTLWRGWRRLVDVASVLEGIRESDQS